jgi:hypothetical protein
VIEHVLADGRQVPLPGGSQWLHEDNVVKRSANAPVKAGLEFAPGAKKLELGYTAASFIAPEHIRFRYRLEGRDEDWIDAGAQRSAVYSRLAPGDYQFRVTACNSAGVWSETGQSLDFVVLPFFWQTSWFRVLVLAVIVAACVLWIQHVRKLHRRIRQLEQAAGASANIKA